MYCIRYTILLAAKSGGWYAFRVAWGPLWWRALLFGSVKHVVAERLLIAIRYQILVKGRSTEFLIRDTNDFFTYFLTIYVNKNIVLEVI